MSKKNQLQGATILLNDNKTHLLKQKLITDASGMFYFQQEHNNITYIITALKEGFVMESTHIIGKQPLVLFLSKNMLYDLPKRLLMQFFASACGMLFETLLVVSFLFEVLIFQQFGQAVLPFVLLSCGNLLLWIFFIRQHKMRNKLLN